MSGEVGDEGGEVSREEYEAEEGKGALVEGEGEEVIGGKGERDKERMFARSAVGGGEWEGEGEGGVALSVQSMVMCVGKSILSLCSCGFKSTRAA